MIEVLKVRNSVDILKVGELCQRIAEQAPANNFLLPGGVEYDKTHFTVSLQEILDNNLRAVAFFSDHAFILGEMTTPLFNRRVQFAVERLFVSAWGAEAVGHAARVIQVFEHWANVNGASSIFITIQDPADLRRGDYLKARGYTPLETLYQKTLPLDDAIGDVEEIGKIE